MQSKSAKYLTLFAAILLLVSTLSAQERKTTQKNPEGTEFYLTFMRNFNEPENENLNPNDRLILELFITSDKDANVVVEIQSLGYRETLTVTAGTVKNVLIDRKAQILSDEIIEKKAAVHVTSDYPVTIYGLNRRKQTTDTYLALPNEVLGTEYRVICYNVSEKLMPQFAIVATEDSTRVTIIPKVETEAGRLPGIPFDVVLHKGDVYQVTARYKPLSVLKNDLTGSLVIANKKVSVFSGHQCAYVPDRVIACNHLVEQVPPTPSWGKHFFIGKLKQRSKYTYRVLSNQNQTRVFKDAKLMATINEGEFIEESISDPIQITADKPVLVAQYSQGYRNGDSIGDPMMLLISPTQQFLKKYRFATPVNGYWKHYINVVAPTRSIKSLRLNGKPLEAGIFEPLGISRYSIAYISVEFGTHVIEGAEPFGMYSYGFGYDKNPFDAYGTIGGQSFVEYEPVEDTIPPVADKRVETDNFIEIIVRDDQVDDTGLKSIKTSEEINLRAIFSDITEGSPQALVRITAASLGKQGSIKLTASDKSGNISNYTVCYYFDKLYKKFVFSLNEGTSADCKFDEGYFIGVFGKINYTFNSAAFGKTQGINYPGSYEGYSGAGGYAGLYFSKYFSGNLVGVAKLSIENNPGKVEAVDTIGAELYNPDNGLYEPYQEASSISYKGISINLSGGAEYYLTNNLYLAGGAVFSLNPSKTVEIKKRIVIPNNRTFSNNQREIDDPDAPEELEAINPIRFGLYAGGGFSYLITRRIGLFVELNYNYFLTGMLSDADWDIRSVSLLIGAKYRL